MPATTIYKLFEEAEIRVGLLDEQGQIFRASMDTGRSQVGRVAENKILRTTAHDEHELGAFDAEGHVWSHGLFEGGAIGWTDPDGVVVRAGLIFGEEEVGRIEGDMLYAAGAALLLLFLPEDEEAQRNAQRN